MMKRVYVARGMTKLSVNEGIWDIRSWRENTIKRKCLVKLKQLRASAINLSWLDSYFHATFIPFL